MAVVSIQILKKSYFISDKGIPILSSLNLEVNSEEIVSVEGASGVGKSTLLNIIGALDDFLPQNSEIILESFPHRNFDMIMKSRYSNTI